VSAAEPAAAQPVRFEHVGGVMLLCCDRCGPAENLAAASVRTPAAKRWLGVHRHPAPPPARVDAPALLLDLPDDEYGPPPPGWRAAWDPAPEPAPSAPAGGDGRFAAMVRLLADADRAVRRAPALGGGR
jgi:hypothetical protein